MSLPILIDMNLSPDPNLEKTNMRNITGRLVQFVGLLTISAGVLLAFGNVSGRFRTFPYLGSVVMWIGATVVGAGSETIANLLGDMRRAREHSAEIRKEYLRCRKCGLILSSAEQLVGICESCAKQ